MLESGTDVTFMDDGAGGMSSIESWRRREAATLLGAIFRVGRESREVTLRNASTKIVALAQQLRLRQDHVDTSFYFYKLALSLTRGSSHVILACVYITCRANGTSHMPCSFTSVMFFK